MFQNENTHTHEKNLVGVEHEAATLLSIITPLDGSFLLSFICFYFSILVILHLEF